MLAERVRDYIDDELLPAGRDTHVWELHAAYFSAFVAEAALGVRGPDQLRWLRLLDVEFPNIRAALAFYGASG